MRICSMPPLLDLLPRLGGVVLWANSILHPKVGKRLETGLASPQIQSHDTLAAGEAELGNDTRYSHQDRPDTLSKNRAAGVEV